MNRVEDDPKRSLADDPNFLASLSELDHGMAGEPVRPRGASAPAPRPAAPARGARPLLELFPPSATQPAGPPGFPVPAAPPAAPARRSAERPTTCETFYGLDEPAFSLSSTDLKFLYQSAAYDRAAQAMLGAIARRDGIVVLTGALGLGKTMLCRAVIDQLDRRTLISFIEEPFQSIQELLKKVLVDFGVISRADATAGRLRNADASQLAIALRDFLQSLAPLQAFAVVIVDDAHTLPRELVQQLRILVESEGDERLLQLVLVGQPQLARMLARRDLRPIAERIAVRCTLGPLGADEIGGYVTHRLRTAGSNPRVDFDERAFGRLFELSRGNPRVVNMLCDRALATGYDMSASTIDEPIVDAAADAIDLALPMTRSTALRILGIFVVFTLLAIVGAASAALVFRDDLAAVLKRFGF